MSRTRHPLIHLLRVALLLLLLSMQSFTLAHELDQSIVHDGSVCAVCSIGGHHEGAINSQPFFPVEIGTQRPVRAACESLLAAPARYTPEARAPPTSC